MVINLSLYRENYLNYKNSAGYGETKINLLYSYFALVAMLASLSGLAQIKDSLPVTNLKEVRVKGYKKTKGAGYINPVDNNIIYAGKKATVIDADGIDANKSINNTRQVLGRIPGLNIVESETGGFVANGIGIRGLNPVQSLDLNVRQNGYNVAADVYGYNETYYLPPMEAVSRIEMIKGAAAIQFGSQIGGMVNYVLKEGAIDKPISYSTMQTAGSNGLFNSYHAAGGTTKKWNYTSFVNYRTIDGWRANSQQKQFTGYAKIAYQANNKVALALEYTLLRNRIKMPGGLTDDQFAADSRASVRSRNWLSSPWNVLSASMHYAIHPNTSLNIKSTLIAGQRNLVWVSELPGEADLPDPVTAQFANREIDKEAMKSIATEIRLLHSFNIGNLANTLAAGSRFASASFHRQEDATGTNGTGFNLSNSTPFVEDFKFGTINIAFFIEDYIKFSNKLSVTPGIRYESLVSEVDENEGGQGTDPGGEQKKSRGFVLLGLGLQYKAAKNIQLFGNISQSYRPVDYAQLLPFSTVTKVDPDMKDPRGWNADIGARGSVGDWLHFDIGAYLLNYNNRIGLLYKADSSGEIYTLRTNVDKSVHAGIESYIEFNISRALRLNKKAGGFSLFNSFAYTHARYTRGIYKGNQVEYAPAIINRIGCSFSNIWFRASLQVSDQSNSFSDAANTIKSSNPIIGRIPGYTVLDFSATVTCKKYRFKGGINNIFNKKYFTQRTDEYPGPGIIPSIGRGFYIGAGYNL